MATLEHLAGRVGLSAACAALQVPRSTVYRARQPAVPAPTVGVTISARALSAEEKTVVRQTLNGDRFQDDAPREVYATLLDAGVYLCSWRTMYRILAENKELRERRNQ